MAGIAPAAPLPQAERFAAWLQAGLGDLLPFLKRDSEVRSDIRRWYPKAKSVLVCGFQYGRQAQAEPGQGRIARYAAYEDYHEALKLRMESVLAWLKREHPGAGGRAFVDSSPVQERTYAAAAGLGWVGRNSLLISEEIGSFFLIAGLALDLDLEPDRPVADRCGSCRRCRQACPAGALGEDGLDARRCTACLTIEHRGAIPEELRAGVGCWVAGCDLCQEACPYNRVSRPGVLRVLLPASLPLSDLAALDEAGFRRRFGPTPIMRLKRRGLVRNALLAMGNSADPSFRPSLERFREDPDPVLREQALWSLARLPSQAES